MDAMDYPPDPLERCNNRLESRQGNLFGFTSQPHSRLRGTPLQEIRKRLQNVLDEIDVLIENKPVLEKPLCTGCGDRHDPPLCY